MSIAMALFMVLVFTTFFNTGIQAYIHQEAYPLLAFVGKAELPAYLKEFERRLTVPLLVPTALALLSNLILFFVRPAGVELLGLLIVFILALGVHVVTGVLAAPIYKKNSEAGDFGGEGLKALVQVNLIRLVLSILASVVAMIMLVAVLSV